MNQWIKITVMSLLLSAILFGCSKVNRDNYEKIKVGMEYQQVISIIGEPQKCDAALGIKKCVWGNENRNITVSFIGNKVFVPSMKGL